LESNYPQIVTRLPLSELWRDQQVLPARRKGHLTRDDVRDLHRIGPIQFVIANIGDPLRWVPLEDCYKFFKSEISEHLVDNPDAIFLDEFKNNFAYCAIRWDCPDYPAIVVLEKFH
jgi:hypothetical protein